MRCPTGNQIQNFAHRCHNYVTRGFLTSALCVSTLVCVGEKQAAVEKPSTVEEVDRVRCYTFWSSPSWFYATRSDTRLWS